MEEVEQGRAHGSPSARGLKECIVEQSRLSPFARAVSHVIFDLLSLTFCVLLLWQLARFEISSFRFDDHAPTYLATPLWIPQAVMVLGAAAVCFSMVRTLAAHVARVRAFGKTTEGTGEP